MFIKSEHRQEVYEVVGLPRGARQSVQDGVLQMSFLLNENSANINHKDRLVYLEMGWSKNHFLVMDSKGVKGLLYFNPDIQELVEASVLTNYRRSFMKTITVNTTTYKPVWSWFLGSLFIAWVGKKTVDKETKTVLVKEQRR